MDELFEIFRSSVEKPFLVGGYLRHQYDGGGFSDIDWFCLNEEAFNKASLYFHRERFLELYVDKNPFYRYFLDKDSTKPDCLRKHQIFFLPDVNTVDKFLYDYSDYTINKIMFDGSRYYAHENFAEDIIYKKLRFSGKVNGTFPIQRKIKFINKGYLPFTMT